MLIEESGAEKWVIAVLNIVFSFFFHKSQSEYMVDISWTVTVGVMLWNQEVTFQKSRLLSFKGYTKHH